MAKANTRLPIMVHCTIVEITAENLPVFPSVKHSIVHTIIFLWVLSF